MTKKQFLILLFEVGYGLTFSIGGTLALSEIFLVLYFVFHLKNIFIFLKITEFRNITRLYIALFGAQLVAEIVVGNAFSNSLKILAVTLMSYLHLTFLLRFFFKDRKYVLYALAGITLRYFIFGSTLENEASFDEIAAGEAATFVKFVLINLVFNPILIISVLIKNKKKAAYLVMATGLLFVLLGARSSGAFFALTGILGYLILKGNKFNKTTLIRTFGIIAIVGYSFFSIYVSNVLSGNIDSGNSWQIKQLESPYNPINLLIMGRTETFVGAIAFADKFWTGHGAWTRDTTGKYLKMIHKFRDTESKSRAQDYIPLVPGHSVIIGAGVRNGVFALICMFLILFRFLKIGLNTFTKKDPYVIICIYFVFQIAWNGMFSPIGHFRTTFPLYFAFLLVTYLIQKNNKKFIGSKNYI
jgi:hypothetical protein